MDVMCCVVHQTHFKVQLCVVLALFFKIHEEQEYGFCPAEVSANISRSCSR